MANERAAGPGELLAASVAEQLREKADLDKEADEERRAAEERAAVVERHKDDEREVAREHGGDPETFRSAREIARRRPVRRRPRAETWFIIGLGLLALLRAITARR